MMSQACPQESSLYSDPFQISPCKSPHRYPFQPSKLQQEAVPSSLRPYPVSTRAYNRKDYDYIASFPRGTQEGGKLNQRETELLHCQEICTDDVVISATTPKQSHAALPKFGAWNDEASVEGFTDVFDHVREQKRGGSSPAAQSQPQHLHHPIRRLAKELTLAKIPSPVSTHHRRWSPSSWGRCFVAPVTSE